MSDKSFENGEEKVSDLSSNKRMKEMLVDRLSALPDEILIRILSFLGVQKSAAVTSVLSKRWEFIWAELPRLEFKDWSNEIDKKHEFVAKVNRTLLIRSSNHLEKFHVYFRYGGSFASDVDSWIDFVVKNKAKEVNLILESEPNDEFYDIPEMMCSNPSLTLFSVQGCSMNNLTKIEWGSLTRLDINDSELPQHVLESILSGCPVLHTLSLEECLGFNCLDIKSRNLYKLEVHDIEYREDANGPLLKISAPYVHSLDISFNPEARKLVLKNIKSLVSAKINFTASWCSEEILVSTTEELFEILKDVKELMLGRYYFKNTILESFFRVWAVEYGNEHGERDQDALSELVVDGWQLPISRRKCLTVFSFSEDEHNISGIFALLKFSPNLEKFVIEGFDPEGETWDEDATEDLDCDLLHLKTVEINDFADAAFDGEPMLTVVETLLKRATVLEEMTIRLGVRDINEYTKIALTLLTYPRSSGKAVVQLC